MLPSTPPLYAVCFGRSADYRHMVGGFEDDAGLRRVRGGCAQIVVSDDLRLEGAPLPAGYREQVRALSCPGFALTPQNRSMCKPRHPVCSPPSRIPPCCAGAG